MSLHVQTSTAEGPEAARAGRPAATLRERAGSRGLRGLRFLWVCAALFSACAGPAIEGDYRRSVAGQTLVVVPPDTAAVRADPPEDVLEAFPDDGGPLSPVRYLSGWFGDRFPRSLAYRLRRTGVQVVSADSFAAARPAPPSAPGAPAADSAARDSAAAKPAFTLRIDSLSALRRPVTTLMPKVGNVTQHPVHLSGRWSFRDEAAGTEAQGRFRAFVTTARSVDGKAWRNALDEAARQVAEAMPFQRK